MENKITVSIIVPCFNQGDYLNDALQSIVNQSYTDWECIIINDGSNDDTEKVAKNWVKKDNRFRYFYTNNQGVSNARNLGIQSSKGNYIQFLDSDDILEKEKIKHQVKVLNENVFIDIVYSPSRYFFNQEKALLFPIHYKGVVPTTEMNFKDNTQKDVLIYRNVCTICSSLYRKKIFTDISFKNIVYEDWYFHIECALNNFRFHFITKENCNSLIRMTSNSQLIRHDIENKKNNFFKSALDLLLIEKNFSSVLIDERDKIVIHISTEKSFFKIIINNFVPPIIVKILKKIKL